MSKAILRRYKEDYAAYLAACEEYKKSRAAYSSWLQSEEKKEMDEIFYLLRDFGEIPEVVSSEHLGWDRKSEAVYCLREKKWCKKSTTSETTSSSDGLGVRTRDYSSFEECDYIPTEKDLSAVAEATAKREALLSEKASLEERLAELKRDFPEPVVPAKSPDLYAPEWDGAKWFFKTASQMGLTLKKRVEGPWGMETIEELDFPALCRVLGL